MQPIYQQSIYQQPFVETNQSPQMNNGFAKAGLIIGIFAICLCWIPAIGLILALLGLTFSIIGIIKSSKFAAGKGKAIAGIVLAGIALPISILFTSLLGSTSSKNDYDQVSKIAKTTTVATQQAEKTSIAGTQQTEKATTTTTTVETTVEELMEINPDIPLGTTYELGQGNYEVGEDIPAGRYRIEWISGNQYGGYMNGAKGKFVDDYVVLDPDEPYTCILEEGTTFEISLITARFTKVSSLPNNDYLQEDGTYILGSGFYFEGIDIPCGKYDMVAISGNDFGLYVSTKNDSYIALDIEETYSNLKLNHEGSKIEISLGTVKLTPKD